MEIDLIRQRDQIHARDITRVGGIVDREAKMTRDLDPIIGKDIREVEVGAGVLRQQGEEIYRIGDLPSLHLIPSPLTVAHPRCLHLHHSHQRGSMIMKMSNSSAS
jgi:hypothetical protein